MGDEQKSAPVAKSSRQNPSGIPMHLESSEGYLECPGGFHVSWTVPVSLAVHGSALLLWSYTAWWQPAQQGPQGALHKPCVAAACSALPPAHRVTSPLERGDTHSHHACTPVLSTDRGEEPTRLLTRLSDDLSLFAILTQSQQGGKPPNHVGQPAGAQAGTKPKSIERESVLLR